MTENAEEAAHINEQVIGLTQAKDLEDLTSADDYFFNEYNQWITSIENNPDIEYPDETIESHEVEELGLRVWEKWGKDKVDIDKDLHPLAGMYLAMLGSSQKMTPEDLNTLKKRLTPLSTETGWNSMLLYGKYISSISNRRRSSPGQEFAEKLRKMEEKIWEAFQKEGSSPQTPKASPTT